MADMLSQDEIDALLKGVIDTGNSGVGEVLSEYEADALGEIGNIAMGTAATTLSYLLGKKVSITTPHVEITDLEKLSQSYPVPHVGIRIEYTKGLVGSNILVLRQRDVRVIADIMMGGDGKNAEGELEEIHLSAISEAMNQMVGSSSTSMAEVFGKTIEISPPESYLTVFDKNEKISSYLAGKLAVVSFKMTIGELVDSEMVQIMPVSFAKALVGTLMGAGTGAGPGEVKEENAKKGVDDKIGRHEDTGHEEGTGMLREEYTETEEYSDEYYDYAPMSESGNARKRDGVRVQPARFESLDDGLITVEKKNIRLIMDVPLEVAVELGRTQKLIKDILELSPGSIIELDKLAGDPVDILVNGRKIAKGEVVVIDESFGVRITDIVHPAKRL